MKQVLCRHLCRWSAYHAQSVHALVRSKLNIWIWTSCNYQIKYFIPQSVFFIVLPQENYLLSPGQCMRHAIAFDLLVSRFVTLVSTVHGVGMYNGTQFNSAIRQQYVGVWDHDAISCNIVPEQHTWVGFLYLRTPPRTSLRCIPSIG